MPKASGRMVKYSYRDHDADVQSLAPPILNQWYTVFDAEDVRLLWCYILQTNVETAAKDIEVRWTIDGTVYFKVVLATNNTSYKVYKDSTASLGGTSGLAITGTDFNAALYTDKRGQSFKVEIRIITALGTNQTLLCRCVRETLEET